MKNHHLGEDFCFWWVVDKKVLNRLRSSKSFSLRERWATRSSEFLATRRTVLILDRVFHSQVRGKKKWRNEPQRLRLPQPAETMPRPGPRRLGPGSGLTGLRSDSLRLRQNLGLLHHPILVLLVPSERTLDFLISWCWCQAEASQVRSSIKILSTLERL